MMKDREGAVVFDFEQALTGMAGQAGDDDNEEHPRSQVEMNEAAVTLLGLLPQFGSGLAPIFNYHQAQPAEEDLSAACEEVGTPVPGKDGLRRQVELAHPDASRRCFLSHSPLQTPFCLLRGLCSLWGLRLDLPCEFGVGR